MLERYKTVLNRDEEEIIEKKSRFIATVMPIENEKEAQAFIEELKKKYWNASHNVFAYQIGDRNEIQRFSDDGEPSGTAGMPVLDVLKGEQIKNTVVVVTRYFGGTLLGTGGLVRAYGKAAKEGIKKAIVIEKVLYKVMKVIVDYTLSGKVQYAILNNNHIIKDTVYTDKVEYIVLVESDQADNFHKQMEEVTSANGKIHEEDDVYGAFIDGELMLFN